MRFVSQSAPYTAQVQRHIAVALGAGLIEDRQEPIYARFEPYKLLPHERQIALERWSFTGLPQEADEVTTVQPDFRIGVFDSQEYQNETGCTDEVRELIEAKLMDQALRYDRIFVAPKTLVQPPWPKYDEYRGTPTALVRKLVDEGHDLELVLEYEEATQNRAAITAALLEAIRGEPSEEEVVG